MNTTRRELLWGAASVAAVGAADEIPGGIIDTHTHFYDPFRPQGVPWPAKNETTLYRTVLPKEYAAMVEPLGIKRTIVVEASAWVEDNQWILDLARANPIIAGLVGRLDPASYEFPRQLERFRKNPIFLGIRTGSEPLANRLGDADYLANLRLLASAGLTLDVVGPKTLLADVVRLNDRIPTLRIVIDHLPFDGQGSEPAFRELASRRAVFAKVSWVIDKANPKEALDQVFEVFGPDRVVYGSNWPVSDRIGPYPKVLQIVRDYFAAKGADVAAKYFHRNSIAAYRWK